MSTPIDLFLQLQKVNNIVTRRFDRGLGGLGFNEFAILLSLSKSKSGKMSRIELAESVGLTASGVTRILAPMEKVGYIKREADKEDKRISLVSIAGGGRTRLENCMEDADLLAESLLPKELSKKEVTMLESFKQLSQFVK